MKKLVFPLFVALAFAAGIGAALLLERGPARTPDIEGLLWPDPRTLQAFTLVDQDGDTFDLQNLRGRWTLLFFGFTFCPDICPSSLNVFVSVDPGRDTPERVGEYVRFFDPGFTGVTGSEDALESLTAQLGVIAFRTEPDADGNYLVDHTAAVLLLDPQARLVGLFRTPHEASDIAARVRGIMDFGACHTRPEGEGPPLAGGRALETPFGTFHAPNITPHPLYGIGNWSAEDLAGALHEGVSPDGYRYAPVFPYTSYTRMRRDDVLDLHAYLMTLTPVARPNLAHEVPWYLEGDLAYRAWRLLEFRPGRFTPNPGRDAEWNRGAYLATALAHCGECHTPRGPTGAMDLSRPYAGNPEGVDGEATPNITSHEEDGVGSWDVDELVTYFELGMTPWADFAGGAMAEVIDNGLSHLTDADREALAVYVHGLPPIADAADDEDEDENEDD